MVFHQKAFTRDHTYMWHSSNVFFYYYELRSMTLTFKVPGMLTRPAGHEAEAEARKSEAEDEAEGQKFFRGRGQTH